MESQDRLPFDYIYIAAHRLQLEQTLHRALTALAEHRSDIIVQCTEEVMNFAAESRTDLREVGAVLLGAKNRKQVASGEQIAKMIKTFTNRHVRARRLRNAFFIGTPHTAEQAEALFKGIPGHLFFVGQGLDGFSTTPYHNIITAAARRYKDLGGHVSSVSDNKSPTDIMRTILCNSRMEDSTRRSWLDKCCNENHRVFRHLNGDDEMSRSRQQSHGREMLSMA